MSWEFQVSQIIDEIGDMASARTHTKYNHSKKQLRKRVDNLKNDSKGFSGSNKTTADLYIYIGERVLEGKMGEDRGLWAATHLDEFIEELNRIETRKMERASVPAVTVRQAANRLRDLNAQYDALGEGEAARDRHRIVEAMRAELGKTEVSVALQAAKNPPKSRKLYISRLSKRLGESSPIPGVLRTEWQVFSVHAPLADQRVHLWDRTQEEHAEEEAPMPQIQMIATMVRFTPQAVKTGALSLKMQQYRSDPVGQRAALETSLSEARSALAADPAGEGAERLREVIGQAEALVAPEETATPLDVPPQVQVDATVAEASGPNWLLLGGLTLGLAAAVTTTVIVVKKVRGRKKGGK